ncbi:MAG: hypothetical protein AAF553_09550, partial [Pseudomonadota bacterium]
KLQLAEANALTGALKFVPVDADGDPIEPRGGASRSSTGTKGIRGTKGTRAKGKFATGKRGRPGNIRHQGRRRK